MNATVQRYLSCLYKEGHDFRSPHEGAIVEVPETHRAYDQDGKPLPNEDISKGTRFIFRGLSWEKVETRVMEDQSEKPEIQSQESEKSDTPAEAPKMTPVMMKALLHMLLTSVHGITVPQQTFDTYDPNAPMCMTFEPTLKVWRFWIPQPVIVTPAGTNGGALVTPPRKIARRLLRKRGF